MLYIRHIWCKYIYIYVWCVEILYIYMYIHIYVIYLNIYIYTLHIYICPHMKSSPFPPVAGSALVFIPMSSSLHASFFLPYMRFPPPVIPCTIKSMFRALGPSTGLGLRSSWSRVVFRCLLKISECFFAVCSNNWKLSKALHASVIGREGPPDCLKGALHSQHDWSWTSTRFWDHVSPKCPISGRAGRVCKMGKESSTMRFWCTLFLEKPGIPPKGYPEKRFVCHTARRKGSSACHPDLWKARAARVKNRTSPWIVASFWGFDGFWMVFGW